MDKEVEVNDIDDIRRVLTQVDKHVDALVTAMFKLTEILNAIKEEISEGDKNNFEAVQTSDVTMKQILDGNQAVSAMIERILRRGVRIKKRGEGEQA